jgi:hypothetical protein
MRIGAGEGGSPENDHLQRLKIVPLGKMKILIKAKGC